MHRKIVYPPSNKDKAMSDMATAVVVNYMRPDNIPLILDSLVALPWVDEVIVWDNSPPNGQSIEDGLKCYYIDDTAVVWTNNRPRNEMLHGRFLAAQQATNDWIITQDDDYIVRNWEAIRETALANPGMITGSMFFDSPHNEKQLISCGDGCWDIMLGWGSMFRKELIGPVFKQYIQRWGIDDVLLRDADRVFAVGQGAEHICIEQDVQPLDGISGEMSMHRDRSHKCISKMARSRAVEMVRERRKNGRQ